VLLIGLGAGAILTRHAYLGAPFDVANRVRDAHSPIVTEVVYHEPNPFEGAPPAVWIYLGHDTTQKQVNAFWCDVVLPAGGTEQMYRDQHLILWQSDQRPYDPGYFYPDLQCANATRLPKPSPRIASSATISCTASASVATPQDCPLEIAAVETAVAELGYDVQSVVIHPYGFPCDDAFAMPRTNCAVRTSLSTAYVTFVGTDKVASLTFTMRPSGLEAHIVNFLVPPAGLQQWMRP
jgi:hypothetical protein